MRTHTKVVRAAVGVSVALAAALALSGLASPDAQGATPASATVDLTAPAPGHSASYALAPTKAQCVAKVIGALKKQATARGTSKAELATMITAVTAQANANCVISLTTKLTTPAPSSVQIPPQKKYAAGGKALPATQIGWATVEACDGPNGCQVNEWGGANWSETFQSSFLYDRLWSVAPGCGWNGPTWNRWSATNPGWHVTEGSLEVAWCIGGYGYIHNYSLVRDHFTVGVGIGWFTYSWDLWLWENLHTNGTFNGGQHGGAW